MSTKSRPLTEKETEVFQLMAVGLTNEQIAAQIETGPDNVKKHVASIFGKIGAETRTQAVSLGFRGDLLNKEDIDEMAAHLGYGAAPIGPSASE